MSYYSSFVSAIIIFSCLPLNASGQQAARASRAAPAQIPASAAAVAETNSMEVLDVKRGLSVGDRISYRVVEDRKDPKQLVVTDSGEIEVPLIGRIYAAGKNCRQLAYDIKKQLEKDYYNRATVIIGVDIVAPPSSRGTVYIMGQVRSQGALELPPNERLTISKAILRVGGFAEYANQRKVKLVRKKEGNSTDTMIIDVEEILKGNMQGDVTLVPEDLIVVPQRMINF
jgi:protein involved in polysaccharide export with SLBB domain